MNVFDSIDLFNVIPIVLSSLIVIVLLVRLILYDTSGKRRFQAQRAADQKVTDEVVYGQPVVFSGDITPSLQEEVRKLYLTRDPLYPIIYVIFAILMLVAGVIVSKFEIIFSLGSVVIAIMFLIIAFWLPQLWWRWWWPQYISHFGPTVSGKVYPAGVQLSPNPPIIGWNDFMAAETNDTVILLYLSRSYAYPIHRSMLKTDSDWQEVISLSKKHIRNFKRRG